jgi:hypothetical protein
MIIDASVHLQDGDTIDSSANFEDRSDSGDTSEGDADAVMTDVDGK